MVCGSTIVPRKRKRAFGIFRQTARMIAGQSYAPFLAAHMPMKLILR